MHEARLWASTKLRANILGENNLMKFSRRERATELVSGHLRGRAPCRRRSTSRPSSPSYLEYFPTTAIQQSQELIFQSPSTKIKFPWRQYHENVAVSMEDLTLSSLITTFHFFSRPLPDKAHTKFCQIAKQHLARTFVCQMSNMEGTDCPKSIFFFSPKLEFSWHGCFLSGHRKQSSESCAEL